MIPLSYRLRDGVRVEESADGWMAVSELPLAVVRVNAAAARLLELTRGGSRVADLAAALSTDEERILKLCEYYRRRGMLDVDVAPAVDAGDAAPPSISVIVPTKDRAAELDDCLAALFAVDYPREGFEVIVVDDGSRDQTPQVTRRYPCRYLANDRNRGQSYSRNVGARAAAGEILAFIDSDCVASPEWLRELVPFFFWPSVAAVGGFVAGFCEQSRLDRYEQAASSLNMGDRLVLMSDDRSMGYVPTCNLLVRRDAYLALGGLREDLRVGEDVDLCWRLRAAGWRLVYSPTGTVRHRHRNRLRGMLGRRAAYGTSEAVLHALHPDKRKTMPVRLLPALTAGIVAASLVGMEPRLLLLSVVPLVGDGVRSTVRLAREGVRVRPSRVWFAAVRGHLSFLYSVSYHLVRYYLLALAAAGFAAPGLWLLALAAVGYVAVVDYRVKRPRLSFPAFAWFSVAEHAAYQVGVAAGCVRERSLRSYLLRLGRAEVPGGRAGRAPVATRSRLSVERSPSGS
ncbi:MAG: mycofactocin biosynthesis glycosyltransferase MftF [Thermoleophilia bacterium]